MLSEKAMLLLLLGIPKVVEIQQVTTPTQRNGLVTTAAPMMSLQWTELALWWL